MCRVCSVGRPAEEHKPCWLELIARGNMSSSQVNSIYECAEADDSASAWFDVLVVENEIW